jgi:hypothetical protein
MTDTAVIYAAVYDDVDSALADLDAVDQMYEQNRLGEYGAAVIDKEEGKGHVVRRIDRPNTTAVEELLGTAVPSESQLERAANGLQGSTVGLIVIGEPKVDEKAWEESVTRASTVVKRDFSARTDAIAEQMKKAFAQ